MNQKITIPKIKKFIKESRKKGFSDLDIKEALLKKKIPLQLIQEAYKELNPRLKLKNQVCLFLNNELILELSKRAKKNIFSLEEQIEDILRRSTITQRKKPLKKRFKIDDPLVQAFIK